MNNSLHSPFSIIKLLLLVFFYLSPPSLASSSSFLKCLYSSRKIPKSELAKIIYTPNNINYTSILQDRIKNGRFNTSSTRKPTIILTPFQESQVQEIVTCSKKSKTRLRIRSGGHDFEGLSYTSKTPFAILDTFNLKSIDINVNCKTAWVQAGATLGELYYRIWQKSTVHAFPAGVCPTVGIGGHFSGGGYGNMLRKYGLSVDNIVDARIVDAKGRILDRKGMGEDLFWAIRGGGGASFGVILSYKINLVPVPPLVTVFQVSKTLEENAMDLVYHWQFVADKFDKDLFIRVFLQPINGTEEGNSKRTIRATFIALFLGDANKMVSYMKSEFPELGLRKEDCKEMTWIKSVLYWAGFPGGAPEAALLNKTSPFRAGPFKIKSDYVKIPISKERLRKIFQNMLNYEIIRLQLNPYGGRMNEISESETPFPHRAGNIYKIQYSVGWNETGADVDKSNIDKIREFYNYTTPFVSKNPREAFLNYRDLDVGSTDNGADEYNKAKVYGLKYFKRNFDRLVQVKTKVDPTNFFRNEQSIPCLKKQAPGP